MFLYNITLQPPTAVFKAICGNFSGTKQQEIILAQINSFEFLRLDFSTGKLHSILRHNVFGVIRSIVPFRLMGSTKDYLVIASDSGRIVVLSYNPERNVFDKVHEETYGKSGCRRVIPGQYLTSDPKGRAVMIGAVEKQRLVYILNRDSLMNLTISSPLEVNRSSTIIYDIIGIDVGFENPIFACIEVDYSEADQDPTGEAFTNTEKHLSYYELDLGFNHVVRKGSDIIDPTSNLLVTVPGGSDGPGGVLICSENCVTWRNKDCTPVQIPVPHRKDCVKGENKADKVESTMIVAAAMHKLKSGFFVLIQSEKGDIFKITMDYALGADSASNPVKNLKIKYFDTIPVGNSLCLLKSGFLFVASEFGNHNLYQIEDFGNDEEGQKEYQSLELAENEIPAASITFNHRPLRNLSLIDTIQSLCPLTDAKLYGSTNEESPVLYTLCGRGSNSTFRLVKYGREVTQLAESELPGIPNGIWTVKKSASDEFDTYIIVSFLNATLVLSIGETVEEVVDSVFLTTVPTIMVAQVGDNALIQVYPNGLRYVRSGRKNEWRSSENKVIVKAACNKKQIVVVLSKGELVYFELDVTGHLNEYHERKELSYEVTALALGEIPSGRQRSKFLAVGCSDNTVRIISLDPTNCFQLLSIQALRWAPTSLMLTYPKEDVSNKEGSLSLHIGLASGILISAVVDSVTGILSDSRLKYLGTQPVRLSTVRIGDKVSILALSSRAWLSITHRSLTRYIPLIYNSIDYASGFRSEQCPDAIVGVSGNNLSIITVEAIPNSFSQSSVPLKYTPRRLTTLKSSNNVIIIESEHNTWCKSDIAKRYALSDSEEENSDKPKLLNPEQFGNPRAEPGRWGSCIRVIDPSVPETVFLEDLDNDDAAFSLTTCIFQGHEGEQFVIVGIAKGAILMPRSFVDAYIATYRIINDGKALELVHKTPVEDIPYALYPFQGKLLAGVGEVLRLYSMGKKRLLRKCESKKFPSCIVSLNTQGNRIILGTVRDSFFYAVYKSFDNRITVFADDTLPRGVTSGFMADYDTICGGDKFGNIYVIRLPNDISQEIDEDTTGNKLAYVKGYLQGAPYKLESVAVTYVGDIPTYMAKASLVPGGSEVIVYVTFLGGIGALIPFQNKDEAEFFRTLEMQMRIKAPALCGSSHLAFRSYYIPCHNVIDGDLCEMYELLNCDDKAEVANELERDTYELSKKIQDMRRKYVF